MMNILTVGDSWTEGIGSSNLQTKSWPAQMAKKYNLKCNQLRQKREFY